MKTHEELIQCINQANEYLVNAAKLFDEFCADINELLIPEKKESNKKPLEEYSWEEIGEIIADKRAKEKFELGDIKEFNFCDKTYHARIIHFNEDGSVVFDTVELMTRAPMFEYIKNDMSFENSDLFTVTLTMIDNTLEKDESDFWCEISSSFIPSYEEVFGNDAFALYKKDPSVLIKKYHGNDSADSWWLRSPSSSNSTSFCIVYDDGSAGYYDASYAIGVAPCFVI